MTYPPNPPEQIIERLGDVAKPACETSYRRRVVLLADAEAAVHAAADAARAEQTQEIVEMLAESARAIPLGDRSDDSYNVAMRLVREVARRFPNGGTNASS